MRSGLPGGHPDLTDHPQRIMLRQSSIWLMRLLAGTTVLLAVLVLAAGLWGRFWLTHHLEQFRPQVESALSAEMAVTVHIGKLEVQWQGILPTLVLEDVRCQDGAGRVDLSLDRVTARLALFALLERRIAFSHLDLEHPRLRVQRRTDGRFVVAGVVLPAADEAPGSPFVDWLLTQHDIRISDGEVTWQDVHSGRPALVLPHLQFRLQGSGHRHRFDIVVGAPTDLLQGLHVFGDFHAADSEHLAGWHGALGGRADFIDLARLRDFVELPSAWRSGRGGTQVDLQFAGTDVQSLQADSHFDAVGITLAADLPELRFDRLTGHFSYRLLEGGFELAGRQLLAVAPGVADPETLRPADFSLRMTTHEGEATADILNLGAMAALTESLPMPLSLRAAIRARAPVGLVRGLQAHWTQRSGEAPQFTGKVRLVDVSLHAAGGMPGVNHLSGTLQADPNGGHVAVDARKFALSLPALFPEPLAVDSMQAAAHWTLAGRAAVLTIDSLKLTDPALNASAGGTIEFTDAVAHHAHLTGSIERADVTQVPRFLPKVVGTDAQLWLKTALRSGDVHQASFELDGDLQGFPFRRREAGLFHVHVPVDGVRLEYGPGWPALTGLRGVLDFDGVGLQILADEMHQEALNGRQIKGQIKDLEADKPMLELQGQIDGPLQSGLNFILHSPLKAQLGDFASTFKATGAAHLELGLTIPLAKVDDIRVVGDISADGAELRDPSNLIPPLLGLQGVVHFTEQAVQADGLTGQVLGGTVHATISSRPGGEVVVDANGQADTAEIAALYGDGQLGFLRGTGNWQGTFRFAAGGPDLTIRGQLPILGYPADVTVQQHGSAPLQLDAGGSIPLRSVLKEQAPPLADAADGNLDWKMALRRGKAVDELKGAASFTLFGKPGHIEVTGRPGGLVGIVTGIFDASYLERMVPGAPAGIASGTTPWVINVDQRPGQPLARLSSELTGIALALPAPFGKTAASASPLHLQLSRLRGAGQLYLAGGIDNLLGVALLVPAAPGDALRRAALRIGGPALLPGADGFNIGGTLSFLDVDAWRAVIKAHPARAPAGSSSAATAPADAPGVAAGGVESPRKTAQAAPLQTPAPPPPALQRVKPLQSLPINLDLRISRLLVGRYHFDAQQFVGRLSDDAWHLQAHGAQLEGALDWGVQDAGHLTARLDRLFLTGPEAGSVAVPTASGGSPPPAQLIPALDIQIKDFQLDARKLGQFELRGEPEAEGWHIAHVSVTQPHGTLSAEGHWMQIKGQSRTRLTIDLNADDTGLLLAGAGYPKMVSRGQTKIHAALLWPGDPTDFSPAMLSGSVDLDSRNGQFLTVEPGIGRLLGLISLQDLPRRATLDFRDIFSQGFAFDTITDHIDIAQGTMTTEKLDMQGPAARVRIRGSVSLAAETQDLTVRVSPAFGNGVSLASTVLGGPAVGAAAFLLQKLLRNPIDQILTFEYKVSGTWDAPQVLTVARVNATDAPGSDSREGIQ